MLATDQRGGVRMFLSLLGLLLGCQEPYAFGEPQEMTREGLPVRVTLNDLESATLVGQTVHDGAVVVIPRSEMQWGYNEWRFEGEGLDEWHRVERMVGSQDLQMQCSGDGPATLTLGSSIAEGCPLVDGAAEFQVLPWEGLRLEGERIELQGDRIRILLVPLTLEKSLSPTEPFGTQEADWRPRTVTASLSKGEPIEMEFTFSSRESVVAAFFQGLPGTLEGLEAPSGRRRVAVFPADGVYWAQGAAAEGRTVAEADVFVKELSHELGEPGQGCMFSGSSGPTSVPTRLNPTTYVAYDRAGNELGRKTITPTFRCPSTLHYKPGQPIDVGPSEAQLRRWVRTLLR